LLLEDADRKTKQQLIKVANQMMPIFVKHALWRPQVRARIAAAMEARDAQRLREDLDDGIRLASSLGLDVSELSRPV
jgi:hypothetical protein